MLVLELPDLGLEFDGEKLAATRPQLAADVLSPLEFVLYDALNSNGGIMSRDALEREVTAKGMNLSSFHVMIGYSVIIDRPAKGVYALRGAISQPGVVESLMPKVRVRQTAMKDHGHFEDGKLWLVQKVTEAAVKYETLALPAVLRQYITDGQYNVQMNNSPTTYRAGISSSQVRFQGRFLRAQGVEADDFVLLSFDCKGKALSVAFGDEDVFEKAKAAREEVDESPASLM